MNRRSVLPALVIGLLVTALALPGLPRAEAADARFVLTALETFQKNYVDPLPAAPLLNAALDTLRQKFSVSPFGSPISSGAADAEAETLFTQRFAEILSQVNDRYSATDLAYTAVAGMLESLHDSHTGFISPAVFQEEKRRESGQASFTGIGIVLLSRDGQFYVNEVYAGTPAESAGVQPFDRVQAVNGMSTDGLREGDVSAMIRGPAGTQVVLTVVRAGEAQPLEIPIARAPIQVPGVTSKMLDGGIGYVRLHEFVSGVGHPFRDAIFSLRRGGMRALVLDLRGNPGGLVDELRDVSAAILPQSAPFLQMRTRGGRQIVLETPSPPILPDSVPVVVLVDEGTGSAAELLAASLQEQSRAVIAGTKTAGAVEIGITVDLPEGAGMSVTVARVLSGKGARLEGQGVTPDIQESLTTVAMNLGHDSQLDKALEVLKAKMGATSRTPPRPARTQAA